MTAHKNVFTALSAAQMAMEPVIKGAINPAFKGEGKPKGTAYADLSDVVSAVRPALVENGLAYFHQIIRVDGGGLDMRTSLVHGESDTRIDCDVPLIVSKNDMQGMKSATTYAKRIGLESVTGIAPEDDDGNAAAKAAPKSEPKADRPKNQDAIDGVHEKSVADARVMIDAAETVDDLNAAWKTFSATVRANQSVIDSGRMRKAVIQAMYEGSKFEQDRRKADLQTKPADDFGGDSLPY